MSIPKEPRQQMINIMYLVLIALLALNVSNEILNAFKLLNDGIDTSKKSAAEKVTSTLAGFKAQVEKDGGEGQAYLDAATQSTEITAAFNSFVDELKLGVIDKSGGYKLDDAGNVMNDFNGNPIIKSLSNQEGPSQYMVKIDKKAYELKDRIEQTRNQYVSLLDPLIEQETKEGTKTRLSKLKETLVSNLPLRIDPIPEDSKKPDWAYYNFYQMPTMAVVTMLNKFQNDAKNSESLMVDELFALTGAEKIVFDQLQAKIVPNARKFIVGEELEADIFLAATSSQSNPSISAGGRGLSVTNGVGTYKTKITAPGKKTLNYTITAKDGFGKTQSYTEKFEYEAVNPPDHVPLVSADKMNVFYIGVPNPVTAGIAGIRDDLVKVSMSGGTINKGSGSGAYTVNVTSPGKATVNVSGPKATGGTYSGSAEFRVKRIPDPIPMIGKSKGGGMRSGEFKAQGGLRAVLEDFDFEAKFKVISYEVTMAVPNQDLRIETNQGYKFGGTVKGMINNAKPNTIYFFDKIKAKGPDGSTRTLPTISVKIL